MYEVFMSTYLLPCLIVLLSSFVQSVAGFGFGLVSLPLLMLLDWSLPQAMFLLALCSLVQSCIAGFKLRKHAPKNRVKQSVMCRFIFMPLGFWTLTYLAAFPAEYIKNFVALMIPIILLSQKIFPATKAPKENSIFLPILCFCTSGYFSGAIGLGGPVLLLWVRRQAWTPNKSRAFMLQCFAFSLPLVISLLYYKFGNEVKHIFMIYLCSFPFILLGTYLGLKSNNYIKKENFQRIVVTMLLALSAHILYDSF